MPSLATVAIEFDAGHDVIDPHLHHFRFEVGAVGSPASSGPTEGMVLDFRLLREALATHVRRPLEGRMLVGPDEGELSANCGLPILQFPVRPTAEHLAKWAYDRLVENLPASDADRIECVTLWETPYAAGSYRP
jgi:6-pyruvoyl-tetrahydropterin synthase